jgi:hypothetical protein
VNGSNVQAARIRVAGGLGAGVVIDGAAVQLFGSDWIVSDIGPDPRDRREGEGLVVLAGAHVELDRVRIARALSTGLFLDDASTVIARDLDIESIAAQADDGQLGIGLWAQEGSTFDLSNVRVADVRMIGIGAAVSTAGIVRGLTLEGVATSACTETTCAELGGGFGVAAVSGSTIDLSDFILSDTAVCGVTVGERSEMDLTRGVIMRSEIGACVQEASFDTARLRNEVQYRDVGVPLQTTGYLVPELLARKE